MALPLESFASRPDPDRPDEDGAEGPEPPVWPLERFDHSLRDPQRLALLLKLLGPVRGLRCLMLSTGDDGGALNFHLRAAGGNWTWATPSRSGGEHIASLLGEGVQVVKPLALPYCDGTFHRVVVVNVHHRLDEVEALDREIARVLEPGGHAVICTPNGNPRLPMKVLQERVGLWPELRVERDRRLGPRDLEQGIATAGLIPLASGGCSRFFTELLDTLGEMRRARAGTPGSNGREPPPPRAPQNRYSSGRAPREWVRRTRRIFASLDYVIPGSSGYVIAVAARKPRISAAPDPRRGAARHEPDPSSVPTDADG